MVQTIGDYKAVIRYQNCGSGQEKLSQEDMPEERASSLAFSIYFCLEISLLFMFESNREKCVFGLTGRLGVMEVGMSVAWLAWEEKRGRYGGSKWGLLCSFHLKSSVKDGTLFHIKLI